MGASSTVGYVGASRGGFRRASVGTPSPDEWRRHRYRWSSRGGPRGGTTGGQHRTNRGSGDAAHSHRAPLNDTSACVADELCQESRRIRPIRHTREHRRRGPHKRGRVR